MNFVRLGNLYLSITFELLGTRGKFSLVTGYLTVEIQLCKSIDSETDLIIIAIIYFTFSVYSKYHQIYNSGIFR